jgi:hypothetical protein
MDESWLSIELKILEMRWSSLDPLARIFAFVVFVGVAVEIGAVAREWYDDFRDFRRGTIHTPDKPVLSKYFWGLFSSVLVTLGILGELLVGVSASKVESKIRLTTDTLVSVIGSKAKAAGERAAASEQKAARFNKAAEDERSARVKIEQQLEWRRITPSQSDAICKGVSSFRDTKITMADLMGDAEGAQFASDLSDALQNKGCGWIVTGGGASITARMGILPEGLFIVVRNFNDPPPAAVRLLQVLESANLTAILAPGPKDFDPNIALMIFVGVKPRPTAKPTRR